MAAQQTPEKARGKTKGGQPHCACFFFSGLIFVEFPKSKICFAPAKIIWDGCANRSLEVWWLVMMAGDGSTSLARLAINSQSSVVVM